MSIDLLILTFTTLPAADIFHWSFKRAIYSEHTNFRTLSYTELTFVFTDYGSVERAVEGIIAWIDKRIRSFLYTRTTRCCTRVVLCLMSVFPGRTGYWDEKEEDIAILTIFSSFSVANSTMDKSQLITFLFRPFVALEWRHATIESRDSLLAIVALPQAVGYGWPEILQSLLHVISQGSAEKSNGGERSESALLAKSRNDSTAR